MSARQGRSTTASGRGADRPADTTETTATYDRRTDFEKRGADRMFFPVSGWFAAFVITLAIEAPIVAFFLRRAEPDRLRLAILIVFANLATHPIVWYVISQLLLVGTVGYTLVAETWAIAAEALFFGVAIRGLSARRAIAVAAGANATSWLAGRVIGELWPDVFR